MERELIDPMERARALLKNSANLNRSRLKKDELRYAEAAEVVKFLDSRGIDIGEAEAILECAHRHVQSIKVGA